MENNEIAAANIDRNSLAITALIEGFEFDVLCTQYNPSDLSKEQRYDVSRSFYNMIADYKYWAEPTELGNVRRLTFLAKDRLKYIIELKKWYMWNDFKWVEADDVLLAAYLEVIENIRLEVEKLEMALAFYSACSIWKSRGKDDSDPIIDMFDGVINQLKAWAIKSQKIGIKNSCLKDIESRAIFRDSILDYDSKYQFIGCGNGSYNAIKRTFIMHRPEYKSMKSTTPIFNLGAQCPKWEAFLLDRFELPERVQFMQRFWGSGLCGGVKSHMLLMVGKPGTGKTTMNSVVLDVAGELGSHMKTEAILNKDRSNNEYHIAQLANKRLIVMNEAEDSHSLAQSLFKELIDNSEGMTGRHIFGTPFTFKPVCTPILTTNNIPAIGFDAAVWRRLYVIEVNKPMNVDKIDNNFGINHFADEYEGILQWLLIGASDYLEHGYNPPECVINATAQVRADQDVLQQFIDEMLEINSIVKASNSVKLTEVLRVWQEWSNLNGHRGYAKWSSRSLKAQLISKGYDVRASGDPAMRLIGGRLKS
jgi:P4 family phage/plasmid primase-like protien